MVALDEFGVSQALEVPVKSIPPTTAVPPVATRWRASQSMHAVATKGQHTWSPMTTATAMAMAKTRVAGALSSEKVQ